MDSRKTKTNELTDILKLIVEGLSCKKGVDEKLSPDEYALKKAGTPPHKPYEEQQLAKEEAMYEKTKAEELNKIIKRLVPGIIGLVITGFVFLLIRNRSGNHDFKQFLLFILTCLLIFTIVNFFKYTRTKSGIRKMPGDVEYKRVYNTRYETLLNIYNQKYDLYKKEHSEKLNHIKLFREKLVSSGLEEKYYKLIEMIPDKHMNIDHLKRLTQIILMEPALDLSSAIIVLNNELEFEREARDRAEERRARIMREEAERSAIIRSRQQQEKYYKEQERHNKEMEKQAQQQSDLIKKMQDAETQRKKDYANAQAEFRRALGVLESRKRSGDRTGIFDAERQVEAAKAEMLKYK